MVHSFHHVSFLTFTTICQNTDMGQDGGGIDVGTSLGYALKEASSALRAAMEEVLRPLGMNITRYACLELLAQRPGLSNSELARGCVRDAAVDERAAADLGTRGLRQQTRGGARGKALPTRLTPRGRKALQTATTAVRAVEDRMLSSLSEAEQARVFHALQTMIRSLRNDSAGA